jgi:hypothetical protein
MHPHGHWTSESKEHITENLYLGSAVDFLSNLSPIYLSSGGVLICFPYAWFIYLYGREGLPTSLGYSGGQLASSKTTCHCALLRATSGIDLLMCMVLDSIRS